MRVMVAVLCLMLLAPVGARAGGGFADGNKLLEHCGGDQYASWCNGYVSGLVDGMSWSVCLPEGTTVRQVQDVMVLWLRENPQSRKASNAYVLSEALRARPFCKPAN